MTCGLVRWKVWAKIADVAFALHKRLMAGRKRYARHGMFSGVAELGEPDGASCRSQRRVLEAFRDLRP